MTTSQEILFVTTKFRKAPQDLWVGYLVVVAVIFEEHGRVHLKPLAKPLFLSS
jgi:hypothetical protein